MPVTVERFRDMIFVYRHQIMHPIQNTDPFHVSHKVNVLLPLCVFFPLPCLTSPHAVSQGNLHEVRLSCAF